MILSNFSKLFFGFSLIIGANLFAQSAAQQTKEKPEEPKAKAVEFNATEVWNSDIYTREDHKVIVLQNRKFNKAKGFEFGVHGGVTLASAFFNTLNYGVHADYYFNEYFGLEGFYTSHKSTANADQRQVDNFLNDFGFDARKEYHQPITFWGLGLMWAPIYGKFAFFRRNIIHFDIFSTLGAGRLFTESNYTDLGGRNQDHTCPVIGVGTRVFIAKYFSLRFDLKHSLYKLYYAPVTNGEVTAPGATLLRQNFQFTLGTSFIFGAEQ
jgi:outer membrane beta-barrel protein